MEEATTSEEIAQGQSWKETLQEKMATTGINAIWHEDGSGFIFGPNEQHANYVVQPGGQFFLYADNEEQVEKILAEYEMSRTGWTG